MEKPLIRGEVVGAVKHVKEIRIELTNQLKGKGAQANSDIMITKNRN